MKNSKRILTLVLTAVLAIGLLAGCGKKAAAYEVLVSDGAGKPVAGAVPEGFAADLTEYPAPAAPGRVTIVLK